MEKKSKILISIVGPTAIGKTQFAIEVAQMFNTQIISADSRQFYKEMRIGTAVPTKEELQSVPHHFIQHKSICENYTVKDFEKDADNLLKKLFQKHKIVVMVGGSGLYVDAVINGLDDIPDISPNFREELNKIYQNKGLDVLHRQLEKLDFKSFESIDIQNSRRVIRALEVCMGTPHKYSYYLRKKIKKTDFNTLTVELVSDRDFVYQRINNRVDAMILSGLIDEAKLLLPYKNTNALYTVGYQELFRYFEGECSLDFSIEEIKKNTRRFAKRQISWFNKKSDIRINIQSSSVSSSVEQLKEYLSKQYCLIYPKN